MEPMFVLTVKKDGGTQDVVGFYNLFELGEALAEGKRFLSGSLHSRRAIIRLEFYNPQAPAVQEDVVAGDRLCRLTHRVKKEGRMSTSA